MFIKFVSWNDFLFFIRSIDFSLDPLEVEIKAYKLKIITFRQGESIVSKQLKIKISICLKPYHHFFKRLYGMKIKVVSAKF